MDNLFPRTPPEPGLYRHYKGGLYTVIGTATHHETRKAMVLYVSHTYGGLNARPVDGWDGDKDGWYDLVRVPGRAAQPRFTFVGHLPSDTKIGER